MVRLQFEKAGLDDLPLLYQLAKEIWLPSFAPYYDDEALHALFGGMYNDDLLTKWISKNGNELYFIYIDRRPIGYTGVEKHRDFLKLDKIYIHPSLQGKGFGGEAMEEIEQIALGSNLKKIQLRVNRENNSAIRFYQNRRFVITQEIDIPGPDGFVYEDYLMEKQL